VTRARWLTLSTRDQLGHVGAELTRAKLAADDALRGALLERALQLLDFSLDDPRWRENVLQILTLRDLTAEAYLGAEAPLERALAAL
jgi:hypothetical protein